MNPTSTTTSSIRETPLPLLRKLLRIEDPLTKEIKAMTLYTTLLNDIITKENSLSLLLDTIHHTSQLQVLTPEQILTWNRLLDLQVKALKFRSHLQNCICPLPKNCMELYYKEITNIFK